MIRSATLLVALAAPAALSAQVLGLPVVNSGAGSGFGIGAEVAKSNADAGDFTTYGASASFGVGLLGVRGIVSRTEIGGTDVISKGGTATLRIFGGPLIPFRVMIQGGYGEWEIGGIKSTRIPVSLGLAATIPNPAFAIKPWIAPRYERQTTKIGGTSTDVNRTAVSGGIDITLLNGIALRGAYDRVFVKGSSPSILSFGLGFSF